MAYSSDADLQDYQPDILDLGIDIFIDEHELAKKDIDREIKIKWFDKAHAGKVFDADKLVEAQLKTLSVYLVLWKYALPKLTNWVDNDRFITMIDFYKSRYGEELADILSSGVEYDEDDDGTVSRIESQPVGAGRLIR